MIKIFNENDRDFSTNGNIAIEPTKCIETKKKSLNGWYLDVEVSIEYEEYIKQDKLCVVQTKSKLNPQAFRIKNPHKNGKKVVFQAQHVMYDAENYLLLDVRPEKKNGLATLEYINTRANKTSPFIVFSNVQTISTAYFVRKSLLEAWAIIEERWNGVFDADNWNVSFLNTVGHDNGETIEYKNNLQGIEIYEDWSNVCTTICPVGYNGIMLPEVYIESDIQYEQPYTRKIDITTDLEVSEATETELINELRKKAQDYIEKNKYPKISYEITSKIKQTLEIGDTIHVKHPLVNILTEVLEYEYDIVSKKVKKIIFGNYSRDVKTKIDSIKQTIQNVGIKLSRQEGVIKKQTELINTLNKKGCIYINENEILILDKLPKEQAKNVWRWNMGGFGFSQNGYEGPFETAITMDGQINAKFITTGILDASIITTGIIKSSNYKENTSGTSIDLSNGKIDTNNFNFEGKLNGNYDYNSFDANLALRLAVGLIQTSKYHLDIYDVNNDGKIGSADALAIQKHAIKKEIIQKVIKGLLEINSEDPKNCITITKDEEVIVSIGIGGVNTKQIITDNIVCGDETGGVIIDGHTNTITLGKNENQATISVSTIQNLFNRIERLEEALNEKNN